jgi:hypothetical protein
MKFLCPKEQAARRFEGSASMADQPKLPAPSTVGGQLRHGSLERTELLVRAAQRLPKAALHDPVEDWKRLALSAAGPAQPHVERTLRSDLLALLVITFVIASWEAFRKNRDRRSGAAALANDADACLRRAQHREASDLAERALRLARSRSLRARLWKLLAWSAIGGRDPFLAHGAIAQLQADAVDLHLIASYLDSCNRRGEALELLTHARASGHRCRETSKLLIDLLFRGGHNDAIRRVASADAALLSHDEQQAIEAALRVDNDV